nr:DUF2975 domain-containing protein [Sedimentibacter sp.]
MKRGSTLFLKIAIILIGVPVLSLGVFGLTWLPDNPVNPKYAHMIYPIILGMYVSAIPFFIALYQAFKLLNIIDSNQAFSKLSVKCLKNIKFCAAAFSGVYVLIMPFVFLIAEFDDAPGLVIIGMVPIFASIVIAVFAAVLGKLLKEAIDIKDDNDLTI